MKNVNFAIAIFACLILQWTNFRRKVSWKTLLNIQLFMRSILCISELSESSRKSLKRIPKIEPIIFMSYDTFLVQKRNINYVARFSFSLPFPVLFFGFAFKSFSCILQSFFWTLRKERLANDEEIYFSNCKLFIPKGGKLWMNLGGMNPKGLR